MKQSATQELCKQANALTTTAVIAQKKMHK